MADERKLEIVIKAKDEFTETLDKALKNAETATFNVKVSFEELNEAQSKTVATAKELDERLKKLSTGKKFAGLIKGVEGISRTFNETLYRGTKDIYVNFSELAEKYIAGMGKTASDVLETMGITSASEKPQSKAVEELSRNGAEVSSDSEASNEAKYEDELRRQQEHHQAYLEEIQRFHEDQKAMDEAYSTQVLELDKATWDSKLRGAGYAAGSLANIMQNLFVATGSKHRAMFEAMKAFAIAETVIQTYRAAQGAYAALAKINPALGIAAAAAATAAGLARVRLITKTKPEGAAGTISAAGTANPPYQGGSFSAYPVPQRLEVSEEKLTQHVTIQIYNPLSDQNWQQIVEDDIIPALNSATDRNIEMRINVME